MLKIGQTVRIKYNYGGHNYIVGQKYVIVLVSENCAKAIDPTNGFIGNFFEDRDCEIIYTKNFENILLKQYEDELKEINSKKEFLKTKNITESNESEYINFLLEQTLDSNLTKEEKIKDFIKIVNKL